MDRFFNINYELDQKKVLQRIDEYVRSEKPGYICVADGVILNIANRKMNYQKVVNGSFFSICDSSYVPLYLRWLYGIQVEQYCGSQIFKDIIESRKYRMFFMGASQRTLNGLKQNLSKIDRRIEGMTFYELPFQEVDDFDYKSIASMVEADNADIIWVALGAPKQEIFMSKLMSHLRKGVMIAVGAAFKFYSGTDEKRAPEWMVNAHLEFIYRIVCNPRKQLKRCAWIVYSLPELLYDEWKRKK